jgi:hypothetical protein
VNAELEFIALGGDKIFAIVTGLAALNSAAAMTFGNGPQQIVEQCAFGNANQGGSLSPKAGTGHLSPLARAFVRTLECPVRPLLRDTRAI